MVMGSIDIDREKDRRPPFGDAKTVNHTPGMM